MRRHVRRINQCRCRCHCTQDVFRFANESSTEMRLVRYDGPNSSVGIFIIDMFANVNGTAATSSNTFAHIQTQKSSNRSFLSTRSMITSATARGICASTTKTAAHAFVALAFHISFHSTNACHQSQTTNKQTALALRTTRTLGTFVVATYSFFVCVLACH